MHLLYPTRLDLTLALHRIAEFYESPYPQIRGRAFTETEFMRAYAKPTGEIDYFEYWDGFNVPAEAVIAFFGVNEDFTGDEWMIAGLLGLPASTILYPYLIATEVNSDPSTLPHELAHARWYLDPEYRAAMQQELDRIPREVYAGLCADLGRDNRYSLDPGLCADEIQAYLSTGLVDEVSEVFPSFVTRAHPDNWSLINTVYRFKLAAQKKAPEGALEHQAQQMRDDG